MTELQKISRARRAALADKRAERMLAEFMAGDTMTAVAKRHGVCRQRISQILNRAMKNKAANAVNVA